MMGFKMQYLARTCKLKFLSKTKTIPKFKKKSSAKTLSRKRKLQEYSQTNTIDAEGVKLPESAATHVEDGNRNTTEFGRYDGTDELEENMPESAAAYEKDVKESIISSQTDGVDEKTGKSLEFVPSLEENRNENMPRYVTKGKEESPRARPTKKRRGEQFSDPSDSNIPELKEDNEALPEFVVYDEVTSEKSNAVGVMESSEGLIDAWAVGDQNELAGIKRMCLPHAKLAPDRIVIPDDWRAAVEFISENEQPKKFADRDCFAAPPIVVVCGAQNVGKTTFARFLLNNLLRRYKKVGYLDTDVGQPEFTPPGCLSLHIVEKPNPDLSILCLRTPERCHFYGDITPKSNPEKYLHIIINLYEHFRKEYYDADISDESEALKRVQIPLVVNTHGWVKGLGYNVLVDMLRYMVPTHVVQIRLTAISKNLPLGAFWTSVRDDASSTKLLYLGTPMKDTMNKSIVIQKHGRQMRELRIIAYFRQCFGESSESVKTYKELARALASHPPYQVAIQRIKIVHLHCQVPDNEIYYSLNGTIVGLAVGSKNCSNVFSQPVCVGLGIVRGIDIFKGLFHVITPVPIRTLQNVDIFLQGFIEIPTSILQAQGLTYPYMSSNAIAKEGTGAAIIQGGKQRDTKMDRIIVPL
ncbi:polynucleotide 5'-hydroxyl-kinase NOL9 isoform X2 [Cryptomeria japonica]|nr:polynucleotide 5'-hydroxyl-kinase NOL9 isoform X2 [Cryptomeria japonica]